MGTVRRSRRRNTGFSIPELLLAAVLSAAALAIIGELSVLLTIATLTTWSKTEGLAASRFALSRISNDVRHARAFGNSYAPVDERLTYSTTNNLIYSSSPPQGGWPTPPWKAMVLSDTVLIIQQPVFLNSTSTVLNGVPLMLPGSPQNRENLSTIVYEVVPDTSKSDEYLLQVARFPGALTSLPVDDKLINPPQTILKGLIGPKTTSTKPPSVFSYMKQTDHSKGFDKFIPTDQTADLIRGVGIDLEIRNTNLGSAAQGERFPQTLGIHGEAFARNNSQLIFRNSK